MPKDPHISLRIPPETKARLERATEGGNRSEFVRQAIEQRYKRWEAKQADDTEGSR